MPFYYGAALNAQLGPGQTNRSSTLKELDLFGFVFGDLSRGSSSSRNRRRWWHLRCRRS